MYARLWWKDARQFWPVWVFLVVAAAVMQALLLHYLGTDARHGALGASALICASLYAFATGAAAFAGERENRTLRLLDILPIDRRVVWMSKVSFALVTTLGLTLVLLVLAAVGTDRWSSRESFSFAAALSYCMLVPAALGWGLFWSAILSNALTAAIPAICCTAVNLSLLTWRRDTAVLGNIDLLLLALGQLFVFLMTLLASVVIFARETRWNRFHIQFRSPVVVNRTNSTDSTREHFQIQSPVAVMLAGVPSSVTGASGILVTDRLPRRSWIVEARAMVWQTMKEGWTTWCLLAAISPVLAVVAYASALDPFWPLFAGIGVTLVAGASVFGLENRARTQRFLTHHGARPGLAWVMKLTAWAAGTAALWGMLAATFIFSLSHQGNVEANYSLLSAAFVPMFFAIALLCGMALRRGITAVVIAMVIGLILTIPLTTLVSAFMLPTQGLLVIPAGLLVVSWAWSGDWMLDRPGSGRWVRLGLYLAGVCTVAVSWYAGYRAWSIREVGPIAPPAAWIEAASSPLPADQNAADLYREAGRRLVGPFEMSQEFLEQNRDIIDLIRRGAARPRCRFFAPEKLTALDQPDVPPMSPLASLLTLDATERQNHGDLAGAWDDIAALFGIAHHLGDAPGLKIQPIWFERIALGQALEWAVAPGQTLDRLHSALAAFRDLPKPPSALEIIRAEANLVENALDLPASRLREWALESTDKRPPARQAFEAALFELATMPWERVRARRLNHLVSHEAMEDAAREPWQRSRLARDPEIEQATTTSRNAMMLIGNPATYVLQADLNEVARRALVQIHALRSWQLKHNGEFPKTLDALVPEELPSLPRDPYSGRPFGFAAPSDRRAVASLRYALTPSPKEAHELTSGSRVLYSVGPDGRDDGGFVAAPKDASPRPNDIVFEIPPLNANASVSKKEPSPAPARRGEPNK